MSDLSVHPSRASTRALLAGLTGVVLLTAGCGAQSAAGTQGAGQALPVQSPAGLTGPRPTMPTVTPSQSSPSTHTTELAPPVVPGLTWRPQGRRVNGVPVTYVASTAAGHVSLMWMDASRLHFRLVAGTQVPEGAPTAPADRRPLTWVGRMAAAFFTASPPPSAAEHPDDDDEHDERRPPAGGHRHDDGCVALGCAFSVGFC